MRYTTVIDISELREVYRSHTARLVYLHLALKAGYHDHDRDTLQLSIRSIAADVGVTVSACRHALRQLEKAKLLRRDGPLWVVTKWIMAPDISKRPQNKREQQQVDAAVERKRIEEQRALQQRVEEQQREERLRQGKTSYMLWYEGQLKLAAAGDVDAQASVDKKRNREMYEQQCELVKQQLKEKTT